MSEPRSSEPRWDAEAKDAVMEALAWVTDTEVAAENALDALADLGVLVPFGAKVREEWQAETRRPGDEWSSLPNLTFRTEAEANGYRRGHRYPTRLRRRTVHTGPWLLAARLAEEENPSA